MIVYIGISVALQLSSRMNFSTVPAANGVSKSWFWNPSWALCLKSAKYSAGASKQNSVQSLMDSTRSGPQHLQPSARQSYKCAIMQCIVKLALKNAANIASIFMLSSFWVGGLRSFGWATMLSLPPRSCCSQHRILKERHGYVVPLDTCASDITSDFASKYLLNSARWW